MCSSENARYDRKEYQRGEYYDHFSLSRAHLSYLDALNSPPSRSTARWHLCISPSRSTSHQLKLALPYWSAFQEGSSPQRSQLASKIVLSLRSMMNDPAPYKFISCVLKLLPESASKPSVVHELYRVSSRKIEISVKDYKYKLVLLRRALPLQSYLFSTLSKHSLRMISRMTRGSNSFKRYLMRLVLISHLLH